MSLLSGQAPGGAAAALSCTHRCSLKFTHSNPPLFSTHRRRRPPSFPKTSSDRLSKPLTTASAESTSRRTTATGGSAAATNATEANLSREDANSVTLVGQQDVPLEGVIQFEKPGSSSSSLISKWGRVALLAGGDVLALLLFSAIGRFSHGFAVIDPETLRTADPFIAGWFLSAYFLGGYGEDGSGKNGQVKAITAAAKAWALGIPLGIGIRAASSGHIPPVNFFLVTMGSTAVLLIGWRTLISSTFSKEKSVKNDDYRRGSPFELFELLTSLVRRW